MADTGHDATRVAGLGDRAPVMAVQMGAFQRAIQHGHGVISTAHLLAAAAEGMAILGADGEGLEHGFDHVLADFEPVETAPEIPSDPASDLTSKRSFTPLSAAASMVMEAASFAVGAGPDEAVMAALAELPCPDATTLAEMVGADLTLMASSTKVDREHTLGTVVDLDVESFEGVVSSGVTLVECWASWCRPCLKLDPELVRLAGARPDITVAKVDIEAEPELRQRMGGRSVPVLVVFVDGQEAARRVGACDFEGLERLLAEAGVGEPVT